MIGKGLIILISERIRELFEEKLNNNTKNVKFVTGSYVELEDDKRSYVYNVRDGYQMINKQYVSSMISPNIDYQPIPQSLTGYATMTTTFLLNAENNDIFKEQLGAAEEVLAKIIGNYEQIVDGDTTYDSVWTMDGFISSGQTRPLNGTIYTQISTTFYVNFSKEFKMGNRYEYYLGVKSGTTISYNRIFPFDGKEERQNTEDYPHRLKDYESKGGNEESSWVAEFPINVDSFIETNFLADISSETYDLEKTFWYKEKYDSNSHEFKVVATVIGKPYILGDIQTIDVKLIKSDSTE